MNDETAAEAATETAAETAAETATGTAANPAVEAQKIDAMPRCIDVDTAGTRRDTTLPAEVLKKSVKDKSAAEWAYERLILYIQKFEETLDNEHEVAMGFTGSDAGVLRIEGMGFFDPDMITFYGSDPTGARNQLIQHVSQLSVMLRTLPKAHPAEAPNRIGFRLAQKLGGDAKT